MMTGAKFEKLVVGKGARYLAALFTGSKPAAEQKQTVFYLGGDRGLIAELEPLLALISAKRFVIGTNEQACALKLAMNLNIAAQMQALSEALMSCRCPLLPLISFGWAFPCFWMSRCTPA